MIRAALAAATLLAGFAGCGPDEAATPTREYVTYLADSAESADAMRPYLPSVEATFGVQTRVTIAAVPGVGDGDVVSADAVLDALVSEVQPDDAAVVALIAPKVSNNGQTLYGRGREESRVAVIGLGSLQHTGLQGGGAEGESRRARVLLHETGHAVGRTHCDDPWCLMFEANGPEELDRTALVPCEICLASYAAVHAPLKPATLRRNAAAAAKAHGWTIDPPTKKSVDPERSE